MKAELGGQARSASGRVLGNGSELKKSSPRTSSIVALLEGSLISILEINFRTVLDSCTESGKL